MSLLVQLHHLLLSGEVRSERRVPSGPAALEMLTGRNRSLLSNQAGLELTCLRLLCLFHSGDFETRSIHMGTALCVGCDYTRNPWESQAGNSTSPDAFTGGPLYPFIIAIRS